MWVTEIIFWQKKKTCLSKELKERDLLLSHPAIIHHPKQLVLTGGGAAVTWWFVTQNRLLGRPRKLFGKRQALSENTWQDEPSITSISRIDEERNSYRRQSGEQRKLLPSATIVFFKWTDARPPHQKHGRSVASSTELRPQTHSLKPGEINSPVIWCKSRSLSRNKNCSVFILPKYIDLVTIAFLFIHQLHCWDVGMHHTDWCFWTKLTWKPPEHQGSGKIEVEKNVALRSRNILKL